MSANIVIGGAVYSHVADDSGVAVVIDLTAIDVEDPKGPEGEQTNVRYVLNHTQAVQLGALILQHAGPTPEETDNVVNI